MRVRIAIVAAAAVVAILVAAAAANAQSATDQYVAGASQTNPTLDPAGVLASGNTNNKDSDGGGSSGGGTTAAEAGSGGGGKLPFTGYPLTPLVLFAGLLLVVGLTARIAVPALDRRRA